jgi:hypothetical protein
VDQGRVRGQGFAAARIPCRHGRVLNRLVAPHSPASSTSYRLAPALAARLIGRSLVTLAVLVVAATLAGALVGGWWVLASVAGCGSVLVAGWSWWLLRRGTAVRLTDEGFDVRLLQGIGVARAPWSQVDEAVAASPQGQPCLVLRLTDGRSTRLPVHALACDGDAFAHDVRRRLRDAHTPPATAARGDEVDQAGQVGAAGADSADSDDSL